MTVRDHHFQFSILNIFSMRFVFNQSNSLAIWVSFTQLLLLKGNLFFIKTFPTSTHPPVIVGWWFYYSLMCVRNRTSFLVGRKTFFPVKNVFSGRWKMFSFSPTRIPSVKIVLWFNRLKMHRQLLQAILKVRAIFGIPMIRIAHWNI